MLVEVDIGRVELSGAKHVHGNLIEVRLRVRDRRAR